MATNFALGFSDANISYFVGLDAAETNPSMFLTGDRNITNGTSSLSKILELKSNSMAGWTKQIHTNQGNIALADGSVLYELNASKLRVALANTGAATNRLALPLD